MNAVFKDMKKSKILPAFEIATGERMMVLLLSFASVFAAIFILLPTIAIRSVWSQIPHKFEVGVYFAALGLGFTFIEVCLIQKLTLFLGYPSYSLTVTLFSILISAGVGSLVSDLYSSNRNRAFGYLLAYMAVMILAIMYAFPLISDAFVASSLALRIAIAVICIIPVGLGLGAFMPIGIATVSALTPHSKQFIAWAWAINRFFSVVASVGSTMLSMTYGFQAVFALSLGIYAVGVYALSRTPAPAT
jgi:hypothetical protein